MKHFIELNHFLLSVYFKVVSFSSFRRLVWLRCLTLRTNFVTLICTCSSCLRSK